jgi:hypothetical protein
MNGPVHRVRIQPGERVAVGLGHGQHAVEAAEGPRLVPQHPAILRGVQRAADRPGSGHRVAPPDFRFHVVREDHGGAGQPARQVHRREQEVAHDQVEPAGRGEPLEGARECTGPVLPDGVGQRIDQVERRVGVEPERALRRIGARDGLDVHRHLAHAVDVCRRLGRFRKPQVRDLVAPGEVPHQVPRAKLAALIERKQQVRFQPENSHGSG